jgi:hypothetical protein
MKRVPTLHPSTDIAVFDIDKELAPDLTLHLTNQGLVLSQDVYFLGYPYGLETRAGPISLPFVKKAIASASTKDTEGLPMWYLDGFNNGGFSGGPVVFNRPGTADWHVFAVVRGYPSELLEVKVNPNDDDEPAMGYVKANTGIILAYDIDNAIRDIDAYIG